MFKKIAADALGLSDIGKIIEPQDYDKTDADDYVMHEDNEKIYFLIKTKADEYCFTNLALIHVDGERATSSKRTLKPILIRNIKSLTFFLKLPEKWIWMLKLSSSWVVNNSTLMSTKTRLKS